MKRFLAATTALALVGGGGGGQALAEIAVSGDAKLGLDYNSEPGANNSKHSFTHEMGVDFTGSGTTDGGLGFGAKAGFDTGDDKLNTGTVFVSGAFGTITIGGNDAADLLAGGIADVGLNGAGVDDVVEDIRGTTAAQFRCDQSVGSISLAISAGTSPGDPGEARARDLGADDRTQATDGIREGSLEVKRNSYAIGMSFGASGATFGIGYDSRRTVSAGFGYSTGQVSVNAFWAKGEQPYKHRGANGILTGYLTNGQIGGVTNEVGARKDGVFDAGYTGLGIDVSYTVGASTLTLAYAKTDVDNVQPEWSNISANATVSFGSYSLKGLGIGFSHDLGGGAKLVAGFAQVPQKAVGDFGTAEIGHLMDGPDDDENFDIPDLSTDRNVASLGLSFSF